LMSTLFSKWLVGVLTVGVAILKVERFCRWI
jgi:hypothetical protein